MIHVFYLIVLAVIVSFYTKTPSASVVAALEGVKNGHCPKVIPDNFVEKLEEKKTFSYAVDSEPAREGGMLLEGILENIPKENLFDPQMVAARASLDLSRYLEDEIIDEDENYKTVKLKAPNGHILERLIDKRENAVTWEKWEDGHGGNIIKHYGVNNRRDVYNDAQGNSYEISYSADGSYGLARTLRGIHESYGYDKAGNVTGVFVYRREVPE